MMNRRLLVVDDSPAGKSLKEMLERSGYQVSLAKDRDEATANLGSKEFDLLILNLSRSKRDGWQILGNVTANLPWLPVIILSRVTEPKDAGIVPGAAAFLRAPLDQTSLLATVNDLLAKTVDDLRRKARSCLPQS